MSKTENAITVKDLTISYGKNVIIDSANFTIKKHDFVCIVGANGSGKSTLVKGILGLVPLSSGRISFENGIKKTSIGFLPQETRVDKYFPATVSEIVLSGTLGRLGKKLFYKKSDYSRKETALSTLNISKLKDENFTDLSGGQKQKVLLARALAATSDILILDEPSNNLDHASRKAFKNTLLTLNKTGLTILMITHDLDLDDLIGNRVLAIKEGKVFLKDTKEYLRSFR